MFDILIYKCQTTNTKFNKLLKLPSQNDNIGYTLLRYRNLECEIIGSDIKYYSIIPHENFIVNNIIVQINKRIEIIEDQFPNINKIDYDQIIFGVINKTDKYFIINTCHSTYYKILADEYDSNSLIPRDIL